MCDVCGRGGKVEGAGTGYIGVHVANVVIAKLLSPLNSTWLLKNYLCPHAILTTPLTTSTLLEYKINNIKVPMSTLFGGSTVHVINVIIAQVFVFIIIAICAGGTCTLPLTAALQPRDV